MENNNNFDTAQKPSIKPSRFVEVCLGIAIAILLNLLFNTIFQVVNIPSKNKMTEYSEAMKECNGIANIERGLVTKEMCLDEEGVWSEREDYNRTTVVNGEEVKITGTCSLQEQAGECRAKVQEKYPPEDYRYSSSRSSSNPIKFYGGVSVGVILIVASLFVSIFPLTLGFALGGILLLVSSTARYWMMLGSIGKLVLFALGLGVLIFIAIKKFRTKK